MHLSWHRSVPPAVPGNARLREEKTLIFFSTETPWEHGLRGADRLYDVPTGAVFVVRSKAVLELAEGNSSMAIGRGIWLAQPR
jgi:hypothetical protein